MIEDLIICVMFGSLVVYIALFSQGTLGLANAIFPVTLIVGTISVGVGVRVGVGVGVGVTSSLGLGAITLLVDFTTFVFVGVGCSLFFKLMMKSFAFCASITHLV